MSETSGAVAHPTRRALVLPEYCLDTNATTRSDTANHRPTSESLVTPNCNTRAERNGRLFILPLRLNGRA